MRSKNAVREYVCKEKAAAWGLKLNSVIRILISVLEDDEGSGDYSDVPTGDSDNEVMPSRPAAGNTDGETIQMNRQEQKDARGEKYCFVEGWDRREVR